MLSYILLLLFLLNICAIVKITSLLLWFVVSNLVLSKLHCFFVIINEFLRLSFSF